MMPLLLAFALAASLTPAQEADARRLEAALIAPCCWPQQVSVHDSPAAARVRADVRERLAAGHTVEQVLASYEQQYGPAILAEPPARGGTLLLYVLPPVVLLASGGGLVILLRQLSRASSTASRVRPAEAEPPGTEHLRQALDDELDQLD
jgi:cytochrome c-type biogenesis protein CcmH/NrfF